MFSWEFCFGRMRCGNINEAMLILYWITIGEAGKPYRNDTPQISHFFNQHTAAIGRYEDATSRKGVEIQAY